MKVVLHNNLGQPQVIEATRVVVYDAMDNPVSVTVKYGEGPGGCDLLLTAHVGEPGGELEFNALLERLGIKRTVVVVDTPRQKPLNKIRFDD